MSVHERMALTQKEQARPQVLNGILEGQISVDEAAEVGVVNATFGESWRISEGGCRRTGS